MHLHPNFLNCFISHDELVNVVKVGWLTQEDVGIEKLREYFVRIRLRKAGFDLHKKIMRYNIDDKILYCQRKKQYEK